MLSGMKKMIRFRFRVLLLLVVASAVFIIPLPDGTATYTPVSAKPSGHLHFIKRVNRPAPWFGSAPDHFVEGNELYLHFQTTRHTLILVTFVTPGISNVADVQAFRKRHPELERYWPKPDHPDGGIAWTREKINKKLMEVSRKETPVRQ